MEKTNPTMLLISLFLLSGSTAGGALLALKLGGSSAGYQPLFMGAPAAVGIFILQMTIYLSIRERLLFTIVFLATFCLTIFSFMFCLFAPILWIEILPAYAKVIAVSILIALCVSNYVKGSRDFARDWAAVRDPIAIGKINRSRSTIAWEKVQRSLHHKVEIYIPGLPQGMSMAVGILSVIVMLVGLNMRSAFPVFSAFAWAIPCAFFSSISFQLMAYRLAEAKKIREIQTELDTRFKVA